MAKIPKSIIIGTIKHSDLIINAENKLNRSMPEVFRGTGVYENKKDYKRSRDKCEVKKAISQYGGRI